jgi:menaquinone-dependent protoporphyrinogen oxidase
MATILILFQTTYGHTAKVARHIAATLEAHGHQVVLRDVADSPPAAELAAFDAIILGSPVYQNRHGRALRAFARQHRALLNRTPSAFFSVSGRAASAQRTDLAAARKTMTRFFVATGWYPPLAAIVAGAIPYTRYTPFTRLIIRWVRALQRGDTDTRCDYVYTDWDAVAAFAEGVARELAATSSG